MNESETAFSYVCLCEHWFVGSSGDQGDSDEDEDEDDEDNQNLICQFFQAEAQDTAD